MNATRSSRDKKIARLINKVLGGLLAGLLSYLIICALSRRLLPVTDLLFYEIAFVILFPLLGMIGRPDKEER